MNANHVGIVWNPSKTEKADLEAALPTQTGVDITWHETEEDDPGKSATQAALDAGQVIEIAVDAERIRLVERLHRRAAGKDAHEARGRLILHQFGAACLIGSLHGNPS